MERKKNFYKQKGQVFLLTIYFLIALSKVLFALDLLAQEPPISTNKSRLDTQDFDQQDSYLNLYYRKGRYLVYDCSGQYWACTQKEEYAECKSKREKAQLNRDKDLKCAPFARFKTDRLCHLEQQRLTNHGLSSRHCLHSLYRKEFLVD